jgi:hypothetical protein
MSLKDLRSNLTLGDLSTKDDIAKGLTFGKGRAYDRPHQSFSLEPFVKDNINMGGTSTANLLTDGFIRGGYLMHLERAIQDTERLLTFNLSTRGIAWNLKQLGLQLSNPKISEPSKQSSPFKFSPADQRTWNFGLNTIAQIAGQGTGLHVKREGLTPLVKEGYIDEEKFLGNYKPNSNTNRLLWLFDKNINIDSPENRYRTTIVNVAGVQREVPFTDRFNYSSVPGQTHNADGTPVVEKKNLLGRLGDTIKRAFANDTEELYSYGGGPGSTYGIGNTNIYKYTNTNISKLSRYNGSKNIGFFAKDSDDINGKFNDKNILFEPPSKDDLDNLNRRDDNYGYLDSNHSSYKNLPIKSKTEFLGGQLGNYPAIFKDHREVGISKVKNYLATLGKIKKDNYNNTVKDTTLTYRREERIGLGDPGGNPYNGNTTVDLINALDVFTSTNGNFNKQEVRDLIRFRIEAVDPTKPTTSNVMVFRAFLDTLSDSFNAGYNEFKYNGRGESFYTYDSFNRDISFSFKIAAQSAREMKPLYRKLNYLASNTAPEYNQTSGRMMTPFMRLTIGSYFHRLPGVIKTIGIQWQKDYPWDICIDAPEGGSDAKMFVLPHVLDVNITYQPIHDFLPQKGIHSPFIIPPKDAFSSQPERQKWITEEIEANLNGAVSKIKKSSLDLTDIPNVKYQALGPKFKNQQSEAIIKVRDLEETRIIQNTLDHMNELSSVIKETGNEHQDYICEFGFPKWEKLILIKIINKL